MTIKYHEPKIKPFHLSDSPNSWWDEFARDIAKAEQNNREIYQTTKTHYDGMLKLAKLVYGDNSKEYKYLQSHTPAIVPNFSRLKKNMQRKWEKFLEEVESRQYSREYRQRHKEALGRLEKAGYVAGEDFPKSRAISFEKRLGNEADSKQLREYREYEG